MSEQGGPQNGDMTTGPTATGELVARLRGRWHDALGPCLQAALEEADDALFERAEREEADSAQDLYFSAMRELRLQREAAGERFRASIDSVFRAYFRGETSIQSEASASSWSIMDPDEVEEEVAIDATVSRVRGRHAELLARVGERLEPLNASADKERHPLDPSHVVQAFAEALGGVGIAIQPRIIIYKLFEKQLLTALGETYEALDRELAAAGLSSETAASEDAANEAAESANAAGGLDAERAMVSGDDAQPLEQLPPEKEVVGLLHRLVAAAKREDAARKGTGAAGSQSAGGSASANAGGQPADGRVVAGILSALQRSAAQRDAGPLDPEQLKMLVERGLVRREGVSGLESSADQTIDIVSMLFEVILEDERLSDAVKGLFARLQIPVLKVALMDESFLAEGRHPARRLFNTLARAALSWRPVDDLDRDPVYCNIRAAVEQVVEQFSYDAEVFETARRHFEAWQQDVTTEPAAAADGRERVEVARQRVEEAIESRLAEEPNAPDVLGRLLREAWYKVLFITAVKQGVESAPWRGYLGVMDRVIWSVRPKSDPVDRQRMLDDLPDLLQELRDGLNSIMYNPAAMTTLFHELQQAHLKVLETPPAAPMDSIHGQAGTRTAEERLVGSPFSHHASEVGAAGAANDAPDNVVSAEFRGEADEDYGAATAGSDANTSDVEIVRELRAIETGSWFEFLDGGGRRSRVKLQARSEDGQRLFFTNGRGEQVAQYTVTQLAEVVASGDAAPVDEEALFDRALESVIAQLQQQAS